MNSNTIPKDSDPVEDGPIMRSVALHPATSPISMLRATAVAPKEMLRVADPSEMMGKLHIKTAPAAPASKRWNVTRLSPIPSYYRLERTHISVEDSVGAVASRIVEALYSNSVAATFCDREVCCSAHCHFGGLVTVF
jgi:hypothetical protein